jgi:autotransporter adhesin
VRVTGVADGTATYDAVNFGQLQALERLMSRGIASSIATASIPMVENGKLFAGGVGFGTFNGATAVAVGATYRFSAIGMIKATASAPMNGSSSTSYGIGAGWSW